MNVESFILNYHQIKTIAVNINVNINIGAPVI